MLTLVLALTVAAPVPKDVKKDPPSLLGAWDAQTGIIGGKPDNPPAGTQLIFDKDGVATFTEGGGKGEAGSYTFDAKASPAQIDLTAPGGPKQEKLLGIYKIEGDTLTIAMSMGGERPKTFESPVGSAVMLITCKRAKKE